MSKKRNVLRDRRPGRLVCVCSARGNILFNAYDEQQSTGGNNAMIRAKLFNGDGYVKQAAKQGEKPKYTKRGYRWADEQKDIDFCLNCTKEKCKFGICERYKTRGT